MTDYMTANTINDLFRNLFALLDKAAYILLGGMYEILFNVASADIFANDTVQKFYGRVQMIIGVFMLFKLGVSIIQGIINPDTFTDKKSGFSSIISRVVFSLIMLTVLTPINIPGARSSYEINLNNNGLLFGTLYELQDRILENNTLSRLILGTNDVSGGNNNALTQAEKLKKTANMFTSTILKGFVRINMKESGGMDETNPDDRVCAFIEQDVLDVYADLEASPNQILSLVNASCEYQGNDGFFDTMSAFFTRLFTGDRYVFAYLPIVSTIVAAIFIYILLGEIITIAIRSVKLAVLRLLAPIPIISYIDPKSEKDGAFGAWTKALTSTYLELFIHLAVIYFVIYLIQEMIVNGIVINTGTGFVGVLSCIFIWIGLFFFVKQAPKFIKDILGVKGAGGNFGLGMLLNATGALRQGGTLAEVKDSVADYVHDYNAAYNSGKAPMPVGLAYEAGRDNIAKLLTGDSNMTGRKMTRGEQHLDRMGIDRFSVNAADTDSKNKAKLAEEWKDKYSRYSDGNMGAYEKSKFETDHASEISAYEAQGYGHDEAIGRAMYDEMTSRQDAATKAAKKLEKMEGMQKKYGQSRSYEAKYASNRRNRAVFSGGRDDSRTTDPSDPYPNGRLQAWREQYVPEGGDSGNASTPHDSSPGGIDMTPPGGTGSGHAGGPGGPPPRY